MVDQIVAPLLERAWWSVALRGVLGIVLGVVAIMWPHVTLAALLGVLGAYFIIDGVLALVTMFQASRQEKSWWPYLLGGFVSIAVGVMAFTRPAAIAFAILILAAIRCMVTGVVEIATAIWLRRETGRSEWLLWLGGLISIAFGVLLMARPQAGILTLVWLVGIYTIAFGIIATATAFRLRRVATSHLAPQPG
jgi:uncharacterized membrane protein HdeD (DUF308 family)